MQTAEILKQIILKLEKKVKNPHLEAEILLSFIIDKSREYILSYPEDKIKNKEVDKLNLLTKKRLDGEPLAYLIKNKNFYGHDFFVDKNVLIPRPETELMVDEVLSILKKYKNLDSRLRGNDKGKDNITLIDLGTGSGCIPISILKGILENNYKNLKCFAIDISSKALEIAQKNAKKHGLEENISFLEGNLLKAIINAPFPISNFQFLITANLPYLTKEQINNSPSIQKEPVLALDGGKNGMDYYIELFKQIKTLINKYSPILITILAEIDHTQIEIFKKEVARLLPFAKLTIKKDLGGYERLVIVTLSSWGER